MEKKEKKFMTVGEFIEELKQHDLNMPILAYEHDSDDGTSYFQPWTNTAVANAHEKEYYGLPDGEFVVMNR